MSFQTCVSLETRRKFPFDPLIRCVPQYMVSGIFFSIATLNAQNFSFVSRLHIELSVSCTLLSTMPVFSKPQGVDVLQTTSSAGLRPNRQRSRTVKGALYGIIFYWLFYMIIELTVLQIRN